MGVRGSLGVQTGGSRCPVVTRSPLFSLRECSSWELGRSYVGLEAENGRGPNRTAEGRMHVSSLFPRRDVFTRPHVCLGLPAQPTGASGLRLREQGPRRGRRLRWVRQDQEPGVCVPSRRRQLCCPHQRGVTGSEASTSGSVLCGRVTGASARDEPTAR